MKENGWNFRGAAMTIDNLNLKFEVDKIQKLADNSFKSVFPEGVNGFQI